MAYLIIFALLFALVFFIIIFAKIFTGEKVLEIKAEYGSHDFTVETKGYYAILVTGRILKRLPLDYFNAYITDSDGEIINTYRSLLRATSNNGSTGSIQLKYCRLEPGNYQLIVENEAESSMSFLDKAVANFSNASEDAEFGYRIRKTIPEFVFPFVIGGILGCVFGILKVAKGM